MYLKVLITDFQKMFKKVRAPFKKNFQKMFKKVRATVHKIALKADKKNNFMAPFCGWGSTASRLEPLRGSSLTDI